MLVPGVKATVQASYPAEQLVAQWQQAYGIDVARFFEGLQHIHNYRCPASGLLFYSPASLAGDAAFYRDLMQQPWYYSKHKWEYHRVLQRLQPQQRVLEVGSGSGHFVQQCLQVGIAQVRGLELNEAAVAEAARQQLPVVVQNLFDLPAAEQGTWDVVVSFQVMEHIADPLPFLQAMVRLLKPGGQLIMAVPNNDLPWMQRFNLLNVPPHHMLGWTAQAFRYLEKLLPLRLAALYSEPLDKVHIPWYLNSIQQQKFIMRQVLRWQPLKALAHAYLAAGGRYLVKGHSYLGIFEKSAD
jgi:2-polyprenyl-3-methyl-5-hydroxy-6-metoxy-1,4-benzoquinol methylase